MRGRLGTAIDALRENRRDALRLGWGVLRRNFARGLLVALRTRDYGTIRIRKHGSDFAVVREMLRDRDYQLPVPPAVLDRIRARHDAIVANGKAPLIVDAGANIGAASLWYAREWPAARIVAIEPDPGNLALLEANCGAAPRITILPAAIGSSRGWVALESADGQGWAVQTVRGDGDVRIVTMDDAIAAGGGAEPFLCKIDIEGFEADLFACNTDWIARFQVLVIECHDWLRPGEFTSLPFRRAIAQDRFEMFVAGQNIFYVRA
jgi:FkbM family methyltransferase